MNTLNEIQSARAECLRSFHEWQAYQDDGQTDTPGAVRAWERYQNACAEYARLTGLEFKPPL
jgi:hypothetical protein